MPPFQLRVRSSSDSFFVKIYFVFSSFGRASSSQQLVQFHSVVLSEKCCLSHFFLLEDRALSNNMWEENEKRSAGSRESPKLARSSPFSVGRHSNPSWERGEREGEIRDANRICSELNNDRSTHGYRVSKRIAENTI